MKGEDSMMCVMKEPEPTMQKVDFELLSKVYGYETAEDNELALYDVPVNFYDLISQEVHFLYEEHEKTTDKNEKFHLEHLLTDEKQVITGIIDKRIYKVVYQAVFKADSDASMDIGRMTAEEKELFDVLVPVIQAHYDRVRKKCML